MTPNVFAELRFGAMVTISDVCADICVIGSMALIVVAPAATVVASPMESGAILMVATDVFEELHTTDDDISSTVLSENVPDATYCRVSPGPLT